MGMIGDGLEVMRLANIAANAELYEKLGKYVDRAQDLQAKVKILEARCKFLEEQLRFKGLFVRLERSVYVDGDEQPVCSHCADVLNLPVHLTEQMLINIGKKPVCPKCKNQAEHLIPRSEMQRLINEGRL